MGDIYRTPADGPRAQASVVPRRGNLDAALDRLDSAAVPCGILHREAGGSHPLMHRDGRIESLPVTQIQWLRFCGELERSALGAEPLCASSRVDEIAADFAAQNLVPIFIIDARYAFPSARMAARVRAPGTAPLEAASPAEIAEMLDNSRAVVASAIMPWGGAAFSPEPAHEGHRVSFIIDERCILADSPEQIGDISVDFGDGAGFRAIALGQPIEVDYRGPGSFIVMCKFAYSGNPTYAKFSFNVKSVNAAPDDTWTIQSTIDYSGQKNAGSAYVLYGKTSGVKHTSVVNPIILLEPFSSDGSKITLDGWLAYLDGLPALLGDNGFDLVLLSQNSPSDFIQRSAFVAVACLQEVARRRSAGLPIIVVGLNVGAVVARYALAYMEKNGLDHSTACYVSLDGPHQGMNIPLGVQWMVRALTEIVGDSTSQKQAAVFSAMCARQIMYYGIPSHDHEGSIVDDLYVQFCADLRAMGYPRKTLNVGISTGTRDGLITMPLSCHVINWHGNMCINGDVYSAPQTTPDSVDIGKLSYKLTDYSYHVYNVTPYDEAPGSQQNLFGSLAQGMIDSGYGWVDHQHDFCCLVPTVSAVDLNTTWNPYTKIPYAVGNDSFSNFDLFVIEPGLLAPAQNLLADETTSVREKIELLLRIVKGSCGASEAL